MEPKFERYDLCETQQALLPMPKRSLVQVIDVLETRRGFRYLVRELSTQAENYFYEEQLVAVEE